MIFNLRLRHLCRSFLEAGICSVFYILVIFGNYSKLLPLQGVSGNLNVMEILLYGFSIFYWLFFEKLSFFYLRLLALLSFIFASNLLGAFLNGFDILSFVQTFRLASMILSAAVLGRIFFARYGTRIGSFFDTLIRCYFWNASLGLVAMVLFPHSEYFWFYLSQFGIIMPGDPHVGRLVSPYFDPNFYGAIVNIPLLCYFAIHPISKIPKIYIVFILTAGLCTFSRSGIATMLLLFLSLAVLYFRPKKVLQLKHSLNLVFALLLTTGLCYWKSITIIYFLDRFRRLTSDPSALARLETAKLGWDVLHENLLFGIGYNYLQVKIGSKLSFFSLDSSLLTMMTTFGGLLILSLLAIFFFWTVSSWIETNLLKHKEKEWTKAMRGFLIYLWISVGFTSQFNQLLLYPFWLIPMGCIMTYLSCYLKKIRA